MSGRRTSTRGILGRVPRRADTPPKTSESKLEYDLYQSFRYLGIPFEVRPRIVLPDGTITRYVGDIIPDWSIIEERPWLIEVKYKEDLKENISKYKDKFRVCSESAEKDGSEFVVLTEIDIRSVLWRNIVFLRAFKKRKMPSETEIKGVIELIGEQKIFTLQSITKKIDVHMLATLWKMIANNMLLANIFEELSLTSIIELQLDKSKQFEHYLETLRVWRKILASRQNIYKKWYPSLGGTDL